MSYLTYRKSIFGLSLAILIAAAAVILITSRSEGASGYDWPPFTMEYETDGGSFGVGSDGTNSGTFRETILLERNSIWSWKRTVIAAEPSVETMQGVFSRVGSWVEYDGKTQREFDAISGSFHESPAESDGVLVPNPALIPRHRDDLRDAAIAEPVTVASNARLCSDSGCVDRVGGIRYDFGNGQERVFTDDELSIPLRVDDSFVVLELTFGVAAD